MASWGFEGRVPVGWAGLGGGDGLFHLRWRLSHETPRSVRTHQFPSSVPAARQALSEFWILLDICQAFTTSQMSDFQLKVGWRDAGMPCAPRGGLRAPRGHVGRGDGVRSSWRGHGDLAAGPGSGAWGAGGWWVTSCRRRCLQSDCASGRQAESLGRGLTPPLRPPARDRGGRRQFPPRTRRGRPELSVAATRSRPAPEEVGVPGVHFRQKVTG